MNEYFHHVEFDIFSAALNGRYFVSNGTTVFYYKGLLCQQNVLVALTQKSHFTNCFRNSSKKLTILGIHFHHGKLISKTCSRKSLILSCLRHKIGPFLYVAQISAVVLVYAFFAPKTYTNRTKNCIV